MGLCGSARTYVKFLPLTFLMEISGDALRGVTGLTWLSNFLFPVAFYRCDTDAGSYLLPRAFSALSVLLPLLPSLPLPPFLTLHISFIRSAQWP